ncbi:MAG: rod shape-determining protein [Sphingobium sp.]
MASLFSWRRPEFAIDFGTANLRVIGREEGILLDEPSVCCFADLDSVPTLYAAGASARAMVDRTPASLLIKRPLGRGVLQDIGAATQLLHYAVSKACGRRRLGAPHVIIGVPADATQAERSALMTAAGDAGLGSVRLVAEPMAAAIGAGIAVDAPSGTMIVECGAGTTEVAVLSLGGLCVTRTVRVGGASFDKAISDHLHFRHKFLIGDLTAERIKLDYAGRRQADAAEEGTIDVRGRDMANQLPMGMALPLAEIDRIAEKHFRQIVDAVRDALNDTPPELSQDIHDRGIILTGGGAMTPLLGTMLEEASGLPVTVAAEPALCVAQGLHHMLRARAAD